MKIVEAEHYILNNLKSIGFDRVEVTFLETWEGKIGDLVTEPSKKIFLVQAYHPDFKTTFQEVLSNLEDLNGLDRVTQSISEHYTVLKSSAKQFSDKYFDVIKKLSRE